MAYVSFTYVSLWLKPCSELIDTGKGSADARVGGFCQIHHEGVKTMCTGGRPLYAGLYVQRPRMCVRTSEEATTWRPPKGAGRHNHKPMGASADERVGGLHETHITSA